MKKIREMLAFALLVTAIAVANFLALYVLAELFFLFRAA